MHYSLRCLNITVVGIWVTKYVGIAYQRSMILTRSVTFRDLNTEEGLRDADSLWVLSVTCQSFLPFMLSIVFP